MQRKSGDVLDGRDLMLYINSGESDDNPTWTAQALAKTHTITYTAETKERLTKDSPGGAPEKRVTYIKVSIKADALCAYGDASRKALLAAMKSKKPVLLKYGFAEEASGDEYEEGKFVIDSLEETSQVGEDATYSANFSSSGEVVTKTFAGS